MENLTDIKPALTTEHANIYYLEHCRVIVRNERVRSLCKDNDQYHYANLSLNKPTTILLGNKTVITPYSLAGLANLNVLVGMNGDMTQLLTGGETEWFMPIFDERPSDYLQAWMCFWFDYNKRLAVAKQLQRMKFGFMESVWANDNRFTEEGFCYFDDDIFRQSKKMLKRIEETMNMEHLLQIESEFTYRLYRIADYRTRLGGFARDLNATDSVNRFLNHGNYLANGLAATALWLLGIPHDLSVIHRNTQRRTLVSEIAKLIKDTFVLPLAFVCAKDNLTQLEYREKCLVLFDEYKVLDFMLEQIKALAMLFSHEAGDAA